MTMPEIGCKVKFHPYGNTDKNQSHDAVITHLNSDTNADLVVIDTTGNSYKAISVFLWQGDSKRPVGHRYAELMSHQQKR